MRQVTSAFNIISMSFRRCFYLRRTSFQAAGMSRELDRSPETFLRSGPASSSSNASPSRPADYVASQPPPPLPPPSPQLSLLPPPSNLESLIFRRFDESLPLDVGNDDEDEDVSSVCMTTTSVSLQERGGHLLRLLMLPIPVWCSGRGGGSGGGGFDARGEIQSGTSQLP